MRCGASMGNIPGRAWTTVVSDVPPRRRWMLPIFRLDGRESYRKAILRSTVKPKNCSLNEVSRRRGPFELQDRVIELIEQTDGHLGSAARAIAKMHT